MDVGGIKFTYNSFYQVPYSQDPNIRSGSCMQYVDDGMTVSLDDDLHI